MNKSLTSRPHSSPTAPVAQGKIVKIDLSGNRGTPSYDIMIGDSILSEAGTLINVRLGKRNCLVVTDSNVGPLYLARLEAVLTGAGHTLLPSITVPAGEASKDYATLQSLLDQMLKNGVDRKSVVIALGGGVVGDLAGVAASLVLRGVDIVQIPTTLLAQVDSSVGGKTGIDTPHGKNTVGTFYQPRLVLADVSVLDSLPAREMRAGYAEVVKYGLIKDIEFFRWCQANGAQLLSGNRDAQIFAVHASCVHKAKVVAADEREAGERALLNLGHTFGHAMETATGYDLLLHGEAVAIGMAMAFKLSAQMGLCSHTEAYEVRDHLAGAGLPVEMPKLKQGSYNIDELMTLMSQDKKAENKKLTLILAKGIGKAFVTRDVKEADVREVWKEFLPKT
ncbi:MAG TPA: 3-dehydroquinate synthase [Alphaproteobacteria bacterium]|nr:3-dehydroquinate synthase [Alphaproteobacteria bacterium]